MRTFGLVKSKLDGTEPIFENKLNIALPEEYSYMKYLPPVWNQGNNPYCVPYSIASYINWKMNVKEGVNNKDRKVNIKDIFHGDANGMTFKDAFEYLKDNGAKTSDGIFKIANYAKIGSPDSLKTAIVANGPCVGAVNVYNSFSNDFWLPGNNLEGAHAIAFVGYDKDGFIIRNSWGSSYGKDGYWILPYDRIYDLYEIWTML